MKYKIFIVSASLVFAAAACNKTPQAQPVPVPPPQAKAYEVKMANEAFTPAALTVKKGQSVKFINEDTKAHWPAAGAHIDHDLVYDSKKEIEPGQSFTFTFDQVGEWKFHDHFDTTLSTTITVTE